MTTELLPLGTRVTFDRADVLVRDYVDLTDEDKRRRQYMGYRDTRRKEWRTVREHWSGMDIVAHPTPGVIVGARSLANGLTEYEPDYGTVFMASGPRVPVYLVATGLHDGLVKVRRDAVTVASVGDTITVPRPHVLHGPTGVSGDEADADYLREAVQNIRHATERRQGLWGSGVTAMIERLLTDAADALDGPAHAPTAPGK